MKKICFFDLTNTGHHWFYNSNLIKSINDDVKVFYYTCNLNKSNEKELSNAGINVLNRNLVKYNTNVEILNKVINMFIILKEIMLLKNFMKKNDIPNLTLLYLDKMVYCLPFIGFLFKNNNIIGVLHWFTENKIKQKCIESIFKNKNNCLVVHTEYIKNKLISISNNLNIEIINYPYSNLETVDKEEAKIKVGINNDNISFLYFGGTRYDKGIDILFSALKNIKNENINFILAGNESQIKVNNLIDNLNSNINLIKKLQFIKDEEVKYYYEATDFVVIPYRKIFMGESGVISEAINYNKPIIAPNIIHFPELINNNGIIYECENEFSLANSIKDMILNFKQYNENARLINPKIAKEHSLVKFKEKYNILFRKWFKLC